MKLELGKTYRTRGGDVYKIDYVNTTPGATWPFKSHGNTANRPHIGWAEDGRFIGPGQDNEDDLIEEVTMSTGLTLEPGKYYRTRDGRKAYVAGISPFESTASDYRLCGYVEDGVSCEGWTVDGCITEGLEFGEDPISEWREPVKVAGYVNVYEGGVSDIHKSREKADQEADHGVRIACIYVSGEEGVEP